MVTAARRRAAVARAVVVRLAVGGRNFSRRPVSSERPPDVPNSSSDATPEPVSRATWAYVLGNVALARDDDELPATPVGVVAVGPDHERVPIRRQGEHADGVALLK